MEADFVSGSVPHPSRDFGCLIEGKLVVHRRRSPTQAMGYSKQTCYSWKTDVVEHDFGRHAQDNW